MDAGMRIRKIVAITALVLSSFAANDVAPTKPELEAMYDKAFRAFDANNFPEALKQLDAIDARQPDLAESQNLRGVILMREGIYDKAEPALHEALRIDPKFWNARFNLAEIPFLKKDWAEARNRFQDLLSNNISELQGEAAQLIQYKILLTYLLEGKENMVDSILAKFELSPDTPAVHYANAAIALERKNTKEAKDWMAAAEKNFSPQLNKLFAESLYEVGWLQKQAGQSRAALELTTPAERTAKTKAFARSRFEQARQAAQQRDFATARKFVDEADAADPNQASILNLRGEILLEQKEFDLAEAAFKKAAKIDPKFREAQYNLAQIPFKKKDYVKARERFETLFSQTPGGDKNQAAQLIKFKIYMTLLLEDKDSRAQKMMEQFQFTGDTPALYYAQAAWEFKHNNPNKATDWITSAKKIYSPALNVVFADAFYDLGWMQSPAIAGSPGPATEAAAVMSAQTESSPAIEPSPIPGTTVAATKQAKESKTQSLASSSPAASPVITGMEATTSRATESPAAIPQSAGIASNQSIAAGTPAKLEDIAALPAPALSPTVETPVAAASPSASVVASAAPVRKPEAPIVAQASPAVKKSTAPASTPPVVAVASATPATVLAPARVRDLSRPAIGEALGRFIPDPRTLLVGGLVLAGITLLAWVIVPEVRRRMPSIPVYRRPVPAAGPRIEEGNGATSREYTVKNRLVGGPRQVSLRLKASEPSLRRSVRPIGKPVRAFGVGSAIAPVTEASVQTAPEPELDLPPRPDVALESSIGPVIEQGETALTGLMQSDQVSLPSVAQAPEVTVPTEWASPISPIPEAANVRDAAAVVEREAVVVEPEAAVIEPEAAVIEPEAAVVEREAVVVEPEAVVVEAEAAVVEPEAVDEEPMVAAELEPIGQGQPVPYQMPVSAMDSPVPEIITPELLEVTSRLPEKVATGAAITGIGAPRQGVETPSFVVSTEPSVLQPTTPETMPEPQIPTAQVIRTPTTGAAPQPASAMQTAVQLTFSFEIASMQLTPTFKMSALQLRPTSKIVTMRLAPSQHAEPTMNLQVSFEIAKIQPAGGGLGTVRLIPSQQQRPTVVGSSSFTVGGLQLISNFEAAPVQLTPSQQAAVSVTGAFQIATVEFSPSFEIASIVLNSSSKQVAVQLAGAGTVEGAPMFDIANLQLGPSGEIGMMQLNMLGQGSRRAG
jgi:tetratricopeptide (TPR) repeat protein